MTVDQEAIGLARQEVANLKEQGAIQPKPHGMVASAPQPGVIGYSVPVHSMVGPEKEKLVRVPITYN